MSFSRYLINFDTTKAIRKKTDVLIIGCGISAFYSSLVLSEKKKVILLTSGETLNEAPKGDPDPNVVNFSADIIHEIDEKEAMLAGRGLTEEKSVRAFLDNVDKNHERLNNICGFEKTEIPEEEKCAENQDTILYYHKTDAFIESRLCEKVKNNKNIEIVVPFFACDLLTKTEGDSKVCYGVVTRNFETGETMIIEADVVVLSQNGYKGIYEDHYRNSYGDDIAMFIRAGGDTIDMEMIHFWPMVLGDGDGNELVIVPNQMLQDGAILRNVDGERFMSKYNELGEFAPSSLVAHAIEKENKRLKTENVYVGITFKDSKYIKQKHKSLYEQCLAHGINILNEYIPVRTKAGFCIGGIKTDELGRTSIKNVYSCSSSACNGFFGARLSRRNIIPYKVVFAGIMADEILESSSNVIKTDFNDVSYSGAVEAPCSEADIENFTA